MNTHDDSAITRRDALKIIGTGVAVAGLGLSKALAADAPAAAPLGWDLPKLPFAYDALEPHIDAKTMEIHHTKHHQAYITNAKKLLDGHPDLLALGPVALVRELAKVPEAIRTGIRNNVGGHVNHSFFWNILTPAPAATISDTLQKKIATAFGSFDSFKEKFGIVAMARFGSGWAWLSAKPDGNLFIHMTANQDSPLSEGLTPVLGLDVWEHAYYLHYQNRRAEYVAAFWNVVNWAQVEANYAAAIKT